MCNVYVRKLGKGERLPSIVALEEKNEKEIKIVE